VPTAQSTIVLYTELHAECEQHSAIVDVDRTHLPHRRQVLSTPDRPLLPFVYIAFAGRCAVTNFLKSRVWDKVPQESILIFVIA